MTRGFSDDMQSIAKLLHKLVWYDESSKFLLNRGRIKEHNTVNKEFNHCVILLYYSIEGVKTNSVIGVHSDNIYDRNGNFSSSDNSQIEDTPTVTLNLGHSRDLNYYLRHSPVLNSSSKRYFWQEDNIKVETKVLSHGSIHILHPQDEKPFITNAPGRLSWCQIQHGNVRLKKGEFSIGLVFRSVSNKQYYDCHSKMIPNAENIKLDNITDEERSSLKGSYNLEFISSKIGESYNKMKQRFFN